MGSWESSYDAWKTAAPEPEDEPEGEACIGCGVVSGCRCDLDYDRSVDEALTDDREGK